MKTTGFLVILTAMSMAPVVAAQSTSPQFEVASVRVNIIGGIGKAGEPTPVGVEVVVSDSVRRPTEN